ncbi:MAG: diaminopimelate epimerase [Gammaproteobacteria bacterium]|nr:diaminopimelate epimerase [Gammaproteobacteria bacterium]
MDVEFTKMHGLGNDFVLINGLTRPVNLSRDQIRLVADRRFGVGCDQVLLLKPAETQGADVRFQIYNANGREVEQCGNGARCVGQYLWQRGLVNADPIALETIDGLVTLYRQGDGQVKVNMGIPRLNPGEIPMLAKCCANGYVLKVGDQKVQISAVSMGNPHAVIQVDDAETAPVNSLGPLIAQHEVFPNGANVGFMQVIDASHIRVRVWERGVGETLACGTGACAAAVTGRLLSLVNEEVDVALPGGHLQISWKGGSEPVWMTGPATQVFEGRITL